MIDAEQATRERLMQAEWNLKRMHEWGRDIFDLYVEAYTRLHPFGTLTLPEDYRRG